MVFFLELFRLARFAEGILLADRRHLHRFQARKRFGYRAEKAADHGMFLCGHYRSQLGCLKEDLLVERLDGVHIDDADADAGRRQSFGGFHGLADHDAGRYDRRLLSAAQPVAPADLYGGCILIKHRHRRPAQSHVARALHGDRLPHQRLCRRPVAGVEHRHTGNRPHEGNILKGLMAGPVLADRDPCVSSADLDVGARIADGISDDLKGAAGGKHGEGAGAYHLAGKRQSAGSRIHVLLGDAHVEEALRICRGKFGRHRRLGKVGVHDHQVLIFSAYFYQRFAVSLSGCHLFCHYCSPSLSSAASSSIACLACSSFGALPCQPASSSIKETPWPLCVLAMITVGLPLHALALSKASKS